MDDPAANTSPPVIPPAPPQTAPVPSPAPEVTIVQDPPQQPPRKRGKGWLLILIVLMFAVLAGLGGGLYLVAGDVIAIPIQSLTRQAKMVSLMIPFFPKSPEIILGAAAQNHQKVGKNSFDLSVSATGLPSLYLGFLGSQGFDLSVKGYSDFSNPDSPQFQLAARAGGDIDLEVRKKGPTAYLKVNKIPAPLYVVFNLSPDKLNPLLDYWISWDAGEWDSAAKQSLKEYSQPQSQTQKATQEVLDRLLNEEVIPILESSTEKLDGRERYKIVFAPTPEQLDRIAEKINGSSTGARPSYSRTSKVSDTVKKLRMTVWIDQKELLVYRAELLTTLAVPDYSAGSPLPIFPAGESMKNIDAAAVLTLTDYGQDIPITAPDRVKTAEVFIGELMTLAREQGSILESLNPMSQLEGARNAKRKADLNTLATALQLYIADNRGSLPAAITTTPKSISSGGVNLCPVIVPTYLATLPSDPGMAGNNGAVECGREYDTGYVISRTSDGKLVLSAPKAEGEEITVER